jgi:hypothetical protein
MDEIVVQSTARSDFNMLLLTVFGCAALLLGGDRRLRVDVVLRWRSGRRRSASGLALGAESAPGAEHGSSPGHGLAWRASPSARVRRSSLSRLIESLLFGVTARDPMVFVAVPLVLTAVALWRSGCRRCGRRGSIRSTRCGMSDLSGPRSLSTRGTTEAFSRNGV